MSLSATIKSIQDIMRKDVGVDGDAQRISQLVWLLFLKIFDAQEEEMEATRDDYRSPLPQKLRWRNWAADDEGITGDALQKFVNDELFPGLKELKGTKNKDDSEATVLVKLLDSCETEPIKVQCRPATTARLKAAIAETLGLQCIDTANKAESNLINNQTDMVMTRSVKTVAPKACYCDAANQLRAACPASALCCRLVLSGASFLHILRHYFPNTQLGSRALRSLKIVTR